MCNQLKIQQNVCGIHSSSYGTVHDDGRWHRKSQCESCVSGNDPESTFIDFSVNIWRLGSYEDSMRAYGTPLTQRAHFESILHPLGSFLLSCSPWRPLRQLRNVRSLAVSIHETLDSDVFLTSDVTCAPWKWTNVMCETEIEPSCVGIGQKLISVDQKSPMVIVTTFVTFWLRILRIGFIPIVWVESVQFSSPQKYVLQIVKNHGFSMIA